MIVSYPAFRSLSERLHYALLWRYQALCWDMRSGLSYFMNLIQRWLGPLGKCCGYCLVRGRQPPAKVPCYSQTWHYLCSTASSLFKHSERLHSDIAFLPYFYVKISILTLFLKIQRLSEGFNSYSIMILHQTMRSHLMRQGSVADSVFMLQLSSLLAKKQACSCLTSALLVCGQGYRLLYLWYFQQTSQLFKRLPHPPSLKLPMGVSDHSST